MHQAYGKFCREGSLVLRIAAIAGFLLIIAGCASGNRSHGPATLAPYRSDPWDARYPGTQALTSAHYRIFTDLQDPQLVGQLVQVMEGAHQQYQSLCPSVPLSVAPMRCYIFSRREEWAAFTTRHAGKDSAVYLRINRGAYAIDDWFVAFWLGDRGTFGVAAHEGWHQFVSRHFAARMPPALEEGIGCMFENIHWAGNGLPRWDLEDNATRSATLGDAIASGSFLTMADLLRLHAGDVINSPHERIASFYAQGWAMALFLLSPDSRYRPAMDRYFEDLANGKVYRPANLAHLKLNEWHPSMGQPQLEHYLGRDLVQIENDYRDFCLLLSRRASQ